MTDNSAPPAMPDSQGFSLIIPAHNEQKFLPATLRAARAACRATRRPWEIIVVNDSSTDETATVARENGATVVDVQLRNIAAVRNAGAKAARFPRLVFLDADTILPPETLVNAMQALDRGAVGGGAWVDLEPVPKELPGRSGKILLFRLLRFVWFRIFRWAAGCFIFCDRDAFFASGGFPEKYFAAEEMFLSRQLKRLGKFEIVRPAMITSARKLHDYSFWQLVGFLTVPFRRPFQGLRNRDNLDILYQHERSGHDGKPPRPESPDASSSPAHGSSERIR